MKLALYARISTNGDRQETENQLSELREWANKHNGEIVGEYIDEASGSRSDRKALKQLLEDAHAKKFNTVAIWALDRLSREGIGRMVGYLEHFKRYNIKLMSLRESWLDNAGPIGDLLSAIFGWVAQQESARISERIHAGLKTARAKGRVLGRPTRQFDVKKALKLRTSGHSIRQIAQIVGIPRSTLSRVLSQNH